LPLLTNISLLYQCGPHGSAIKKAAIVWQNERIQWLGPESNLPIQFQQEDILSANGGIVVPGLIDSHTHLAFGGWRPFDYLGRIHGDAYAGSHCDTTNQNNITQPIKGILSTLLATRALSLDELSTRCLFFLEQMALLGICTVECKSGYGLTFESELKILRAYKQVARFTPLTIIPTFMGAHFIPPEYTLKREYYVKMLIEDLIPQVATEKLALFCDIFCESIATWHPCDFSILPSAKRSLR